MPEAARREGPALQETIDTYTVSSEEIFGAATDAEVAKLVDDKQFSAFNGTSKDLYKKFDTKLESITKDINIFGTVVAQSYYDMRTPSWYDAITYNAKDIIDQNTNRSITAWIQPKASTSSLYNVISIAKIPSGDPSYNGANYSIRVDSTNSLNEIGLNSNAVISRPGALNFYAKVVALSDNPLTYHCVINAFVLEDLVAIKSDWATQKGYKMQAKEPISILDGVNEFGDHVLSVNVYANQYIAVNYAHTYSNNDAYVVRMDEKLEDDKWYGLIVNIGNSWQQYNVYVWKKHESDKNAKLQNIFYETLRLYPEHIAVDEYTINKSPAFLTNIRLFTETIEEERQANELLSYFSKDGDKLVIADNADPLLRLPYISKQR